MTSHAWPRITRINLRREFRIDPAHPAGFLTEKMALPWQADFADCRILVAVAAPRRCDQKTGKKKRWDRRHRRCGRNRAPEHGRFLVATWICGSRRGYGQVR